MDVNQHQQFLIPDKSYSSIAKRDVTRLAESYGFSPADVGKVNIVVAELVTNLAKFATEGGELLVKPIGSPITGIEVICLDSGPGVVDSARMQEDGFSTYGSAGEGMGAIRRQSDEFDIYSQPGVGTVVFSRIYKSGRKKPPAAAENAPRYEVGHVLVPKPGEIVCGDGLALVQRDANLYLLALDGLGHGSNAHEASKQAAQHFLACPESSPSEALRHIHDNIKRTRGAVGLAANISGSTQSIRYCGIGNIAGKLFTLDGSMAGASYKNIISYNGILGHNIPTTISNQQLDWERNKVLVLHSDGLRSRWDLTRFPNLIRHHATTIAAVLYKTNSRLTDDALVIVCKGKI
ncbi:serine/threonine protein kinase [Pontibacter saemangeumensis]|uniref:Serine/threonine protein kinase n=1 Tax=Pontibacter saemangeumensis TaxID=1084525 RepID=A0ABP8LG24_9BACT